MWNYVIGVLACVAAAVVLVWAVSGVQAQVEDQVGLDEILS